MEILDYLYPWIHKFCSCVSGYSAIENENIRENDREIVFVRDLIQIASSFGHDKDLFHKKVFEIINVDSLKRREIIQIKESLLDENSRAVLKDNKLSDREFALCCLKQQRFSADEIKVMFGVKNIRSIYVKVSRLKKKMKAASCGYY